MTQAETFGALVLGAVGVDYLAEQRLRQILTRIRMGDMNEKIDALAEEISRTTAISALGENGYVLDVLTGFAYPKHENTQRDNSGTFIDPLPPASPPYPAVFTKARAMALGRWPGNVSPRLQNGELVDRAVFGDGVYTGLAIRTRAVTSVLMALASVGDLTDAQVDALFTAEASRYQAIVGGGPSPSPVVSWYTESADVLFPSILANSTTATASTAEQGFKVSGTSVLLNPVVPAGYLRKAGDSFEIYFAGPTAFNSTNTLVITVRKSVSAGDLSGASVLASNASNVSGGTGGMVGRLKFLLQSAPGSAATLVISGEIDIQGVVTCIDTTQTVDTTSAFGYVFSATQSASSSGNTALLNDLKMVGHRIP